MKKLVSTLMIITLLLSFTITSGCSRQPTKKRATKIMDKFFKKYSKEYPESPLGKYPVSDINILAIEEIHKNYVAAYAILNLEGDMAMQTRFTIEKKPPFGWKASSWENMGMANFGAQR